MIFRRSALPFNLTESFLGFFSSEKASGIILFFCTILSMILANSSWGTEWLNLWEIPFANHPFSYWINDGLMAVFFLMIGLEIEREIYVGELSQARNAILPVMAALGGMLIPLAFHLFFSWGSPAQAGAGIPMATDIAFALGILSLLGDRVPPSLKIFLAALAIIDDLGAILVIAFFYTSGFSGISFAIACGIFLGLLLMNRLGVKNYWFYLVPGIFLWHFIHESGIHATITGVLVAFAIPFDGGKGESPSYRLLHFLHKPVAFLIVPLFALANTGILFKSGWTDRLWDTDSLAILTGLVLGKPVGITLFSFISLRTGLGVLPGKLRFRHILGAGFLGGIGFTMSIFITLLAFSDAEAITSSKISILMASITAGWLGFIILWSSGAESEGFSVREN